MTMTLTMTMTMTIRTCRHLEKLPVVVVQVAAKSRSVTTSAGYLLPTGSTACLSIGEFVEILPDQTLVFRWSCRLHEQMSSNDINFHNFKNIKFGQDCFLKLLLSLLSKCHFLTGHCVRRVKVKVASKGLVKTLIPSSEISCKTI